VDRGATFYFTLEGRNQTMTLNHAVEILLVEDNPQDLELALRALRKANLANRIQVARDGAEALEFIFCEGAHAARRIADGPKVILLDLKLPKVDGLEVLKRIKGDPAPNHSGRRAHLVKEQSDVVESYQLGVNSYIVKPVNFERLRRGGAGPGLLLAAPQPAAEAGEPTRMKTPTPRPDRRGQSRRRGADPARVAPRGLRAGMGARGHRGGIISHGSTTELDIVSLGL
jgi:two-component system response regulator